uniref:Sulfhydryl oxidase n=1 Tax=Alexandrium andersonii TaxID=327968 RepID=A0A7S2MWM0_9DINO|mmetsp:Transcript_77758/g.174027  ORF Transcript_77758/g.174027 Transcript_77758/m.174027 type:complete len:163 (+) Transcript_77758:86-574(+)
MGVGSSLFGMGGAQKRPRPPDRAEIGRAAWRYVHTLAANYPEQPSLGEQEDALYWLRSFVRLYPCGLCSREFVDVCSDLPPRLGSRKDYTLWWCEAHNRVRDDLSQPLCRCDLTELLAVGQTGGSMPMASPAAAVVPQAVGGATTTSGPSEANKCAACSQST